MAIQLRRGAYADFDPAKMLPGEMAVVLSGDPAASAGRSVYVCFEAGVVKRFTTYEDFESELQSAAEEVREVFTADIQQAISNTIAAAKAANDAAAATQQAQAAAEAAAEAAEAAAEAAGAYILGDISDKTVTFQVAAARANIQSEDSLAIAFGKLAKFYADVKSHAFVDTVRNLAATEGGRALDAIMGAELAGRIGNLDSLPTANKSSIVAAISEQNTNTTGTVTWGTGISVSSSSLEKRGGVVYLNAFINSITLPATWSETTLGTLPSGYRPRAVKHFAIALYNTSSLARIAINTNGTITLQNIGAYVGSSSYFGFNIAYPAA